MNAIFPEVSSRSSIKKSEVTLLKTLFSLCVALTYGFVLSQLPDIRFMDFGNYLNYAESSWLIVLRNLDGGVLRLLANEPVWLLMNAGLSLFLEPETVVRLIIFLGASSIAWLVLRHSPGHFVWLVFLLLFPAVIKNYIIHLRQGAAIAVFLWGWFAVNRGTRWLLFGLTPFIHASFFFVLALLVIAKALRFIGFAADLRMVIYVAVGIITGLSLGVLAEIFGARQGAEYAFERTEVSGLGFVLWFTLLAIMLASGKSWLREHAFETAHTTFYLATYWLIEVTARIFESGLIVVLLAGLSLSGWQRHAFLGLVLGAGLLTWLLRLGQPALGFAGG